MSLFSMVRWLAEDSVGVMPNSAAKEELKPRKIAKMKWKGKMYDIEVLKVSS